jgi:hypothetical protein
MPECVKLLDSVNVTGGKHLSLKCSATHLPLLYGNIYGAYQAHVPTFLLQPFLSMTSWQPHRTKCLTRYHPFQIFLKLCKLSSYFLPVKEHEEVQHLSFRNRVAEPCNSLFSVDEPLSAQTCICDTAPGPDAIHHQMLCLCLYPPSYSY